MYFRNKIKYFMIVASIVFFFEQNHLFCEPQESCFDECFDNSVFEKEFSTVENSYDLKQLEVNYGDFKSSEYPLISEEAWEKVAPHLIQASHPMKRVLDELFAKPFCLRSMDDFKKAGFNVVAYRTGRGLLIASHPKLRKYVIKTYLDNNPKNEWSNWAKRAEGVIFVQKTLDRIKMNRYFKVPKKWIYPVKRPLKKESSAPYPKNFILLVEDMNLLPKEAMKSKLMNEATKEFLYALFITLRETGYSDCHIDNIPLCRDGKIGLIDLEVFDNHPVNFKNLQNYLPASMLAYWNKLVNKYKKDVSRERNR